MKDTNEAVLTTLDDAGVLTITLNRPERHNAVNGDIHDGLETAFRRAADDDAVRVVVIKGAGKSFCSGGDVGDFADGRPGESKSGGQQVVAMQSGRQLLDAMLAVRQPVVGVVHGYALGLGATIALFCDVVVAAEDAVFGDTHVSVGLVAGDGGAVAWPLLMPLGHAKYYLLTGDRLTGKEAAARGLVFTAVPGADLDAEATRVVERLASVAPMASAGTKATLNLILRQRMDLVLDYGLLREGATFLTEDHREAARAFVEKRPAVFHNR